MKIQIVVASGEGGKELPSRYSDSPLSCRGMKKRAIYSHIVSLLSDLVISSYSRHSLVNFVSTPTSSRVVPCDGFETVIYTDTHKYISIFFFKYTGDLPQRLKHLLS